MNDTQYNGQMKKDKWGSCNLNDTQYNGQMKKDKWGSCNSNDTQYNGQMKRTNGEVVIRMTHNTMAK